MFILSQALAVAIVTGILLFTDRIQQAIYIESATMLAADLQVQTSQPANRAWEQQARQEGLATAQSARLASMLFHAEQMQLTDVRAVTVDYPLRGVLSAAETLGGVSQQRSSAPERGTVWLDEQSAAALEVTPGDRIEMGELSLLYTLVLDEEPGAVLPNLGFSGRALIHIDDLHGSGLVQPGSRVDYAWLAAGDASALAAFSDWLQPRLGEHEKLVSREQGDERTEEILDRAASFLNLGGAVAVLLAGLAAMITATRYMLSQQRRIAIMRAIGASRSEILQLYVAQIAAYSLLALLLGYIVGFGVQALGFYWVRGLIDVPPGIYREAFLAGVVTALFCFACFSLPALRGIVQVSPMRLLRSQPRVDGFRGGAAVFALGFFLLLYYYSRDWLSTLVIYAGIITLVIGCSLLVTLLLRAVAAVQRNGLQERAPMWLSLGLSALLRHSAMTTLTTVTLAMTITLLAVVLSLQNSLLEDWQGQLPEQAPNFFALNILPQAMQPLSEALQQPGIDTQPMYPVARARLVAFNGQSAEEFGIRDRHTLASLDREAVITESATLPQGNELVAGTWHGDSLAQGPDGEVLLQVSVEDEYAAELGLQLGDVLRFSFAGQRIDFRVSSLRKLNWNSMNPNFYFVLQPPGILQLPYTYMTSFHAEPSLHRDVLSLNRQYPAMTLIDIGAIVERVRSVLARVTLAVESVAWVTLVAGLLVLVACLRTTLSVRLHEQSVFRALGAPRSLLQRAMVAELLLTALVAATAGIIAAGLILGVLGSEIFKMALPIPASIALGLPLVVMALVLLVGYRVLWLVITLGPLAIWRAA